MSLDTRGYDPQRLLPQSLEDRLLGWLGRMGGMTLLLVVVSLWLCLVSWSVADPSLTHATANAPNNLLGPLGAIISDLLLQTLGFGAVLALLAPLAWSIELARSERVIAGRVKLGFFPLAAVAFAGALSAFPVAESWPLNHGYGGVLGDGVFNLVSRLFATVNEQRAGLAAALVLVSAAIAMAGKTIGFDADGLMRWAFESSRNMMHRRKSERRMRTLSSYGEGEETFEARRSWWRLSRRAPSQANTAHAERHHDQHYGVPPTFSPELPGPKPMTPSYPVFGYVPSREIGNDTPAANPAPDFAPSRPPIDLAPPAPPAEATSTFIGRGDAFDVNTDAESLEIAKRFAPMNAAQAHGAPQMPGAPFSAPPVAGVPIGPVQEQKMEPPQPQSQRPAWSRGPLAALVGAGTEPAWKRPSLNLLRRPSAARNGAEFTQTVMRGNARLLEDVLADFGVKGEVKDIRPGPVVTLYEFEPSRGTKSSRVIGLADDIARSMSVASIRAAVVPGRNAIGLELPNARRDAVMLREMLESEAYKSSEAILPLALGKSISGEPVVADLARMPHLLVAGTTGSGKSVGINAFVMSLLYRHAPEDCRLLMIDPKMLELSVYNGIPHLLAPVVTDPHKAVAALNWAVMEMEERYKRMAAINVRSIEMFNNRVRNAKKHGGPLERTVKTGFDKLGHATFETQRLQLDKLPHIVVVVDEFADLMIAAGKEVETAVQRLAQMARAAGIHLIMATQRPSVDVITGTIKANFPTRISFKVTSKIDSRTILNEQGAEQLLGQGDMLYSTGAGHVMRVHGAFVADEEVEAIAEALRQQGSPKYVEGICDAPRPNEIAAGARESTDDDLYDRAVAIVMRDRKASTSYVQRRLSIGYNRAADLIERMEREGLISPANNVGKRDIIAPRDGDPDHA